LLSWSEVAQPTKSALARIQARYSSFGFMILEREGARRSSMGGDHPRPVRPEAGEIGVSLSRGNLSEPCGGCGASVQLESWQAVLGLTPGKRRSFTTNPMNGCSRSWRRLLNLDLSAAAQTKRTRGMAPSVLIERIAAREVPFRIQAATARLV